MAIIICLLFGGFEPRPDCQTIVDLNFISKYISIGPSIKKCLFNTFVWFFFLHGNSLTEKEFVKTHRNGERVSANTHTHKSADTHTHKRILYLFVTRNFSRSLSKSLTAGAHPAA